MRLCLVLCFKERDLSNCEIKYAERERERREEHFPKWAGNEPDDPGRKGGRKEVPRARAMLFKHLIVARRSRAKAAWAISWRACNMPHLKKDRVASEKELLRNKFWWKVLSCWHGLHPRRTCRRRGFPAGKLL